MRRCILLLILLTACTGVESTTVPSRTITASAPRTAPAPAVPPRSGVFAVVTGFSGIKWDVAIVGTDGATIAQATADPPIVQPNAAAPWTSASLTRLYYLNNRTEVRFLDANGNSGSVTSIPAGASDQAVFAVSPDDKRIAVSILKYAPPGEWVAAFPKYIGMRMYVEDLVVSVHHVEIFASTSVVEFPVGWKDGRLVIAVSTIACCSSPIINPYNASSYHVADPQTGTRLASLCDNSVGPMGPPGPLGAVCWHVQGGPTFQRWDGSAFNAPAAVPSPYPYLVAMSPDATRVAVGGGEHIRIIGGGPDDLLSESGYVFGWLDANHIVFQRYGSRSLSVFDLQRHLSADWPLAWHYWGPFPPALG